jgi:hypothetical protein
MYRILTEDKNRETIHEILKTHVKGYTITEGTGSWQGVEEKCLAIDLVGYAFLTAESIATEIKSRNEQESVLVLEIPITEYWI